MSLPEGRIGNLQVRDGFMQGPGEENRESELEVPLSEAQACVSGILQAKLISEEEMEKCFAPCEELSKGGFAVIYKGYLTPSVKEHLGNSYKDVKMVIKKMKLKSVQDELSLNEDYMKDYKRHFMADQQYSHLVNTPFLMPLICQALGGFTSNKDYYHCLMFPHMENGDLYEYLFGELQQKPILTWQQRTRILYQIALALEALHKPVAGRRNAIVHRDVKSKNIFLDASLNARLGDNGLCKEIDTGKPPPADSSGFNGRGPYRDPQSISTYLPGSDWYSYGIVGLELLLNKTANVHDLELLLTTGKLCHKENDRVRLDENRLCLAKEVVEGWEDEDAKNSVAYIVARCISGGYDSVQKCPCWFPKDRNEWLGLTVPNKSPVENQAREGVVEGREDEDASKTMGNEGTYLRWTALQPSMLLERLCLQKGIALYEKGCDKIKQSCIACLATLDEQEKKELHTQSSGCCNECTWYCRLCMCSREPLFCPDHGRAMPLIGGDDTYALLMCGGPPFEKDVTLLKKVLEDVRFVGIREENIIMTGTEKAPCEDDFTDMVCAIAMKLRDCSLHAVEEQILRKYPILQNKQKELTEFVMEASNLIRQRNVKLLLQAECTDLTLDIGTSIDDLLLVSGPDSSNRLLNYIGAYVEAKTQKRYQERILTLLENVSCQHKEKAMDQAARKCTLKDLVARTEDNKTRMSEFRCKNEGDGALKKVAEALLVNPGTLDKESETHVCQDLENIGSNKFECSVPAGMVQEILTLLKRRHGTVWVYYSGHAEGGNLIAPSDSSTKIVIKKTVLKIWINYLLKMASNVIVLMDCCEAESSVNDLMFNLNPQDEFSSLSCIASCLVEQKSECRDYCYSLFSALLASVLSTSKEKTCQQALHEGRMNEHSKLLLKENIWCGSCHACNAFDGENGSCRSSSCLALADRNKPFVQCYLTSQDILFFLDEHLCSKAMRCPSRIQMSRRSLPLAYLMPQLFYEVTFRYPNTDEDHIVEMKTLPKTLLAMFEDVFYNIVEHQQEMAEVRANVYIRNMLTTRLGKKPHDVLYKMDRNSKEVRKLLEECFQIRYMSNRKEIILNGQSPVNIQFGKELGADFEEMTRQLRLGLIVMCSVRQAN